MNYLILTIPNYVLGGWNTFLVSLSFLPVVLGFAIAPQLDLYWMWLIGFAVILCCYVLSWVNLLRGKRWKGVNHRILVKFLTSYDLDLIGLAILSASLEQEDYDVSMLHVS